MSCYKAVVKRATNSGIVREIVDEKRINAISKLKDSIVFSNNDIENCGIILEALKADSEYQYVEANYDAEGSPMASLSEVAINFITAELYTCLKFETKLTEAAVFNALKTLIKNKIIRPELPNFILGIDKIYILKQDNNEMIHYTIFELQENFYKFEVVQPDVQHVEVYFEEKGISYQAEVDDQFYKKYSIKKNNLYTFEPTDIAIANLFHNNQQHMYRFDCDKKKWYLINNDGGYDKIPQEQFNKEFIEYMLGFKNAACEILNENTVSLQDKVSVLRKRKKILSKLGNNINPIIKQLKSLYTDSEFLKQQSERETNLLVEFIESKFKKKLGVNITVSSLREYYNNNHSEQFHSDAQLKEILKKFYGSNAVTRSSGYNVEDLLNNRLENCIKQFNKYVLKNFTLSLSVSSMTSLELLNKFSKCKETFSKFLEREIQRTYEPLPIQLTNIFDHTPTLKLPVIYCKKTNTYYTFYNGKFHAGIRDVKNGLSSAQYFPWLWWDDDEEYDSRKNHEHFTDAHVNPLRNDVINGTVVPASVNVIKKMCLMENFRNCVIKK